MINLILAFLIGLRHAFEADHLLVISSMENKLRGGLIWGFFHILVIFLIIFLIHLINLEIPNFVFIFFEFLVGLIIIYFGFSMLFTHSHEHQHKKIEHKHYHNHLFSKRHVNPAILGMVHGLAGSGVLIILMASLISNLADSLIFISFFGLGLLFGAGLFSFVLGKVKFINEHSFRMILGGVYIIYGIYFVIALI